MRFVLVSQAYAQYEVSKDKNTAILINVYGDTDDKIELMVSKLKELNIHGEIPISRILSVVQYGNVVSLFDSVIKI